MATDLEIQSLITDSDKYKGIFHLYKVIYASFFVINAPKVSIFRNFILSLHRSNK